MKLWIVLTADALNHPEYGAKSQKPNIHGVYGSEEEMLKHAAPAYTPQRFFDTGSWTWGHPNSVQFWAVPFNPDGRELRTALGQQWFAPSYKAPEPDQEVVVAIAGDATPHKARYLSDGVFTLLGYPDGNELRAESVAAWRPLPERGEAWPVEPVSFQIRSF